MQTLTALQFSQGKLPLTGMTLTKLEDAEGNEHMFEITGQWGPLPGAVLPVQTTVATGSTGPPFPNPPTTIFFLLFYHVLSEFLSTSVLVEAISSQCPGALPLAAFGDCSVSYGTNLLPQ